MFRYTLSLLIFLLFSTNLCASPVKHEIIIVKNQDETVYLEYPLFNRAWLNEMIEKPALKWFKDLADFKAEKERKHQTEKMRYYSDKINLLYQSENVLVIQSFMEESLNNRLGNGNANGEALVRYINIDLKRKRELSLTDLFEPTTIDQMMIYGEKAFRDHFNLLEEATLIHEGFYFEKGFRLPNTFALTKEGVQFTYNHNELIPFGDTMYNLLIPYNIMVESQSEVRPLRDWVDLFHD